MTRQVMELTRTARHDQRMTSSINTKPTIHTKPINRLRLVLAANATTSALGGLAALAAGDRVDRWLGTGHPGWVRVIGVGLVGFAVCVAALSRANAEELRRWTPEVSLADAGWVVGSVATIIAGWYSTGGAVVIAILAAGVGGFAVAQTRLGPRSSDDAVV